MYDLSKIFPLIVPTNYFIGGNLSIPHQRLKNNILSLTWVYLEEDQFMKYITNEDVVAMESSGIDYQKIAMNNLVKRSNSLFTHEKRDENGNLIFVAMMHDDGLGSSRLLLDNMLYAIFPKGYQIALPERSLELAFPLNQGKDDIMMIKNLISQCYNNGNTPMINGVLMPDDLKLN